RVPYLAALRHYLTAASEALPWSGLRLLALHAAGEEFPVEVTFADEVGGCREVRVRPLHELTDRLHGEGLLLAAKRYAQRTADRMRAVAGAASGMLGARSHDALEEVVRAACHAVVPFDAFTFALYDGATNTLSCLARRDAGTCAPPRQFAVEGTPNERVIRERRSFVTLRSAHSAGRDGSPTAPVFESVIRTPILSADGVLGVISVQSYAPGVYGS